MLRVLELFRAGSVIGPRDFISYLITVIYIYHMIRILVFKPTIIIHLRRSFVTHPTQTNILPPFLLTQSAEGQEVPLPHSELLD